VNASNSKESLVVNQVRIEFTNKPMTSYGGISIMAKLLERISFRGWIEKNLPIEERSNNAKGIYGKVIGLFLTVLCGGNRYSHNGWWSHGATPLKAVFGLEWLPLTSTTLTRFWGKMGNQKITERWMDAARAFARQTMDWMKITQDYLCLDSTVLTRYGNQEGAKRGYNPNKKGRPSHHPLFAYLGCGLGVNLWNRGGDTASATNATGFLDQTLKALEGIAITFLLCDSGFYGLKFLKHLDMRGCKYIMAVALNRFFQSKIQSLTNWRKIADGIEVGEFDYALGGQGEASRRYVAIRQNIKKRPKAGGKQPFLFREMEEWRDYRIGLMVTSERQPLPEEIWRSYRPRANIENGIKELKNGYGIEGFCLKNFWSTEAAMGMIALVFHNLIHYLKATVIAPEGMLPQLKTLRGKYLVIPGVLGSGNGYSVLRLAVSGKKFLAKFVSIFARIHLIPHTLNCIAVEAG